MLKPEQVAVIRAKWKGRGEGSRDQRETEMIHIAQHIPALLADRAEIAQELERIRDRDVIQQGDLHAADVALTALIERIK